MMYGIEPLATMLGVSAALLGSFIVVASLWSVVWKGFALWYAGRAGQKIWFVVLLVVNTLGILEIIYLLFFRPKNKDAAGASSSTPAA